MRNLIIICLLYCFSSQSFARGDEAGNGGGLAEHNFSFAYQKIEDFIALCLVSRCGLTQKEEKV
ncbi:MAG: hypothetical protein HOM21_11780, partial [Halobacteriovoraceae bacterium]|nr:hypothetical protein [Halobacteriovoraceae bacterium]